MSFEPAFCVGEEHLAAIILDQLARDVVAQINVERSDHGLRLSRRRRQRHRNAERLQDAERLAELTGFLALFEIDDKAQPRPGGQGQILLGNAQALARFPDQRADRDRRVFQCRSVRSYRTGTLCHYRVQGQ